MIVKTRRDRIFEAITRAIKRTGDTGASPKDFHNWNAGEWVHKPPIIPWIRKLGQEFVADVNPDSRM